MGRNDVNSRTYTERSSSSDDNHERSYAIRQKREGKSSKPEKHRQSSGDTGSDIDRLHRSLRKDEPDPYEHGIQPPVGYNSSKSIMDHVSSGTRSAEKSDLVSSSTNRHRAASYAASKRHGRVSTMERNARVNENSVDFTNDEVRDQVLGNTTANNFAKSSREVVTKGGFQAQEVMEVSNSIRIGKKQYEALKAVRDQGNTMYVTYEGSTREVAKIGVGRAEKSKGGKPTKPEAYMLLKIENTAPSSAYYTAPPLEYPRRTQSNSPTLGYGGSDDYSGYASAPSTFDTGPKFTYATPEEYYPEE